MKNHHFTKQRGFTLIELMVTIAIVAIVASIAFSDTTDLLARDRAESHLFELKKQLMFARAKSTSTDSIIVVCPLQGSGCTNNWKANTVTVFVDQNEDGNFNAGDSILRELDAVPSQDSFIYSGSSPISFDATGRIGNNQAGRFIYCPSDIASGERSLELTQSGTTLFNGQTANGCVNP